MNKIWRELNPIKIKFSVDRTFCKPGEEIQLSIKCGVNKNITLSLDVPEDVKMSPKKTVISNCKLNLKLLPVIPGKYDIYINRIKGFSKFYNIDLGVQTYLFKGNPIKIVSLEVKW